jgi:hypothetical protein
MFTGEDEQSQAVRLAQQGHGAGMNIIQDVILQVLSIGMPFL